MSMRNEPVRDFPMARSIVITAARLSTSGRMLREEDLVKLPQEQLRFLWHVLRDVEQDLARERRSVRLFPGGPRIPM